MMALHGLRMLGDLAFYYAFAGFFAVQYGGQPGPLVLLWPAACFAAASYFQKNRVLCTMLALASATALLVLPTTADWAAYLPAVCYVVLLVVRGEFGLSAVQQGERFRWLLRAWPLFGVFMLLWNVDAVLTTALPMAITAALALIWFARTARQDLAVSTAPGDLLVSGGLLAALSGIAFLLSRSAVMDGVKTVVSAVYFKLLAPVLQLILNRVVAHGIVVIFQKLWYTIAWVLAFFANRQVVMGDLYESRGADVRDAIGDETGLLMNGPQVLAVVAMLVAAAVLVWAVWRIWHRSRSASEPSAFALQKQRTTLRVRRRWPAFFLGPEARVRQEYRRYLAYCETHGLTILPGDTSQDLTGRASGVDYAAEAELRQIYLRARYAGTATAKDAARAAELVRKICG